MQSFSNKPAQSIYSPRGCTLLHVEELTPQEKLFRFVLDDGSALGHQPGQFVQLSIAGLTEAPISIAGAPTRGPQFELAVRNAGTLTGALHMLQVEAKVGIRGPFGRPFDLAALRDKHLVLIAGGCGLAPLRSLIQYCEDRPQEFASVQIIYGARTSHCLLFKEELKAWQNSPHLSCLYTVDQAVPDCDYDTCHDGPYDGEQGLITDLFEHLFERCIFTAENSCAVIVGPPAMYRPVIEELRRYGFTAPRQIMLSLERKMRCGIGKCGHCTIEHLYCCTDGPVFWLDEVEALRGAL